MSDHHSNPICDTCGYRHSVDSCEECRDHLHAELEKAKIETGEWVEKWESAGHEIVERDAIISKLNEKDDSLVTDIEKLRKALVKACEHETSCGPFGATRLAHEFYPDVRVQYDIARTALSPKGDGGEG